ncbi:alpha/beta hydrolase [Hymenobacter sp. GOD-10R]|uniref:alpha/beta hydrolase family protein n=1 Tax=Hymenobacter sp. GOD-10R TaxID=3093922 RepID=UPI002D77EDCC|nr:alpha/beta hydrolase [Hymenobacter sp. GOD-10R]WRQ30044.1 alpha/beta hydrolase [Hymenobacter sp. GOD-10R]
MGLIIIGLRGNAQQKTPADFGYQHIVIKYGKDTVDVLVLSKKGEERKKKPLFLFVQGSRPIPLIKYKGEATYGVFPFKPDAYLSDFHLAIISKPGIPLVASVQELQPGFMWLDPKTKTFPAAYCQRNYLGYYVARNTAVLKYLAQQSWVESKSITIAGHSEGSTVVARMAAKPGPVAHVIYLSGNPLGRMMTIVAQQRTPADTTNDATEAEFRDWASVIATPDQNDCSTGDSHKTTYSFSGQPLEYFRKASIPVFVGYGTRDAAALFNDYLRLEMIRAQKTNITFRAYPGLEHNFFGFKNDAINYDNFNWDRVAQEFFAWIKQAKQ